MAGNDAVFAGSIPQLYDRHLGPTLFAPYAADWRSGWRATAARGVLETAAGTGIVTAALAAALPGRRSSPPTSTSRCWTRRRRSPGWGGCNSARPTRWPCPFPDRSFDAVVCQFGVMFMPDRSAAYREAARVLRGGGRFLFSAWSPVAENPVVVALLRGLSGRYPGQASWFLERTPHGHGDPAVIAADLAAAGLAADAIETRRAARPGRLG